MKSIKKIMAYSCFTCVVVGIFLLHIPNQSMAATHCVANETDLHSALMESAVNGEGDIIKIQQGTYRGNFVYDIYDSAGVQSITMEGGYSDNCVDRVTDQYTTILDAENNGTVLVIHSPSYAYSNPTYIRIDGLTIQNGSSEEWWQGGGVDLSGYGELTISNSTFYKNHGGGINLKGFAHTNITKCIFLENSSDGVGGGIVIWEDAHAEINDCQFIGNHAEHEGGGVGISWNSRATITNCTFTNNTSQYGGAVGHWFGFPYIYNSTFVGNSAEYGGAISGFSATGDYVNCIFAENTADYGGAMYNYSEGGAEYIPNITNSTFWKNHANVHGGAILNDGGFEYQWPVPITNSIFWENTAPLGPQIHNEGYTPAVPEVTYCNVQGGYPGEGNIDADPLFVDPENGDYHLLRGSPCIDTGTSKEAPDYDMDGDSRPQGAGYDMGAYEYVDSDGDGIPDHEDACPSSDLSGTVVIDGCDSGVGNVLLEDGCTISDLISQCSVDADNHGEFVGSVSHTTNSLKKEGIISGKEKGKIQKCAAKADIP